MMTRKKKAEREKKSGADRRDNAVARKNRSAKKKEAQQVGAAVTFSGGEQQPEGSGRRRHHRQPGGRTGLSNRWVRGNLLVMACFLLLVEAFLMLYAVNSNLTVARQTLHSEISFIKAQYDAVADGSVQQRETLLQTLLQEQAAEENTSYVLQLLDEEGCVYAASHSIAVRQEEPAPERNRAAAIVQKVEERAENALIPIPVSIELSRTDFQEALTSADGTGESIQRLGDRGEFILTYTWRLSVPLQQVWAVRLVTSLEGIRSYLNQVLLFSGSAVLLCFLLVSVTGLYYVKSIVRPLAQVESTANRIARGNFDIRLTKKHNDEIGRLCDTINRMAEDLSATEQMKNEFISSVSHELRTPLTSIKGWIETLQRIDDTHNPNYIRGMHIIATEADRLNDMVEELLDFSRMQTKGLQLNRQMLDLAAELADAVLMVEQRALKQKVQIHYSEPQELLTVDADPNRLRQVFINLLDNALKYSPHESTVTVELLRQDMECIVYIRDEGLGIDPSELEMVKRKFYKGKGAVRGSGIGLAVAEEIMHAHGGTLNLQSKGAGQGTTAVLTFPLASP